MTVELVEVRPGVYVSKTKTPDQTKQAHYKEWLKHFRTVLN